MIIATGQTVSGQSHNCDTVLYPNEIHTTVFNGSGLKCQKSGYRVCLAPGKYYQIKIDSLIGIPANPAIICPESEPVVVESAANYGIRLGNCTDVKIDGLMNDTYGITIRAVKGNGISIDDLSTDVEITGVFIDSVGLSGIVAKTNPDCSFKSLRDHFLLKNLHIHHNYIRKTGTEGMYIGHSFFSGYTLNCNGTDTLVLPHLLENVDIHHNSLDMCGYDAIQVSSASLGCYIHHNNITFDSYKESYGQMSGILIGGGSFAQCYNNTIENGRGMGIEVHGLGNTLIYNNLIIGAGLGYKPGQHHSYSKSGIYVGSLISKPDLDPIHIFNNTILDPKSDGINQTSDLVRECRIQNNVVINPGIFDYYQQNNIPTTLAFVNSLTSSQSIISDNFFSREIDDAGFEHPMNDFRPSVGSPLNDNGSNVSSLGLTFDLNDLPRPQNGQFDIGAYEYQPGQGIEHGDKGPDILSIITATNRFNSFEIVFDLNQPTDACFELFDLSAHEIGKTALTTYNQGRHTLEIKTSNEVKTVYFLRISGSSIRQTNKYIPLNQLIRFK